MIDAGKALRESIAAGDAAAVTRVLDAHPDLQARLDEPLVDASFGQTALLAAVHQANRDVVDALLRAGANINQKSHWWAGGFHVLDDAGRTPGMAPFLLERGAIPEIHHAVQLGMLEDVRRMLSATPALIHARGGDGQLPLHFAQTVEMAVFLLDHGAAIDARDVDHESTAAQYMVRDRQAIARALVARGGATDILMAAALGDVSGITRILDADPGAIRTAVDETWFPKRDPRAGGTIYIWTLGQHKSAPVVAREFGHEDAYRALLERAPVVMQLAVACEVGDPRRSRELLAAHPGIASTLTDEDRRKLADAAQNNDVQAVRLMLEAGWPAHGGGRLNATPLHWAAFHGHADMTRLLLAHGAPVHIKDDHYQSTPLGWGLHGSRHGWHRATGHYAATVEALLSAGADAPAITDDNQGTPAVLDVLRRHAR